MGVQKSTLNPEQIRKQIREQEFRVKKRLGQHFMVSKSVLERIVKIADISAQDKVLEIGPGLGSLTQFLAQKAQSVVAVEIDRDVIPLLQVNLEAYPNTQIIVGDFLALDFSACLQSFPKAATEQDSSASTYKVVGNLPYYITNPIIMRVLEGGYPVESLVVVVQKEVGQRMVAAPNTKEYGLFSVAVQYYAEVTFEGSISANAFWPRPEVDSAIVKMVLRAKPPVEVLSKEVFFATVKAAFGQRRKTLTNALSHGFAANHIQREQIIDILEGLGIALNRRGETLALGEFAAISNQLSEILSTPVAQE